MGRRRVPDLQPDRLADEAREDDDEDNQSEVYDEDFEENYTRETSPVNDNHIDENCFNRNSLLHELVYENLLERVERDGKTVLHNGNIRFDETVPLFGDEVNFEDQKPVKSFPQGNYNEIDASGIWRLRGQEDWPASRKESLKTNKFITGGWSSAEEEEIETIADK